MGQLLNISPKARSQVKTQDLKLEKNTTKISNAVDNMCATIVVVNNIDHSYISKSHEPKRR